MKKTLKAYDVNHPATVLYAGKAVAHARGGEVAGDAFQKGVIDPLMPKVIDYSFAYADKIAPYVATVTGIATGPA